MKRLAEQRKNREAKEKQLKQSVISAMIGITNDPSKSG